MTRNAKRRLTVESLENRLLLAHPAAGDANRDCAFDQRDVAQMLQRGKYGGDQPAAWEEGDFNNDGVFNHLDIVAALETGHYLAAATIAESTGDRCEHRDDSEVPVHEDSGQLLREHNALVQLAEGVEISHTATKSGNWSDRSVWENGELPGDGNNVRIPAGVTLTVDGQLDARLATIRVEGELAFQSDIDTSLKVETLLGMPSSLVTMGRRGSPIDAQHTARLTILGSGPLDQNWDPLSLSRGFVSHGRVEIHGAEKTAFVTLSQVPNAGDEVLRLTEALRGWQVGDLIVVPGTDWADPTDDELRTIAAFDAAVLTLDRPLERSRVLPRDDLGLQLHVANLTRNAIIESQSRDLHERGHVMFMHTRQVDIAYAGFYGLGRTDKDLPYDDPVLDELGRLIPATGTNPRGRYAIHFHRNGTSMDEPPAAVHGSVVVDSPGWGFVNHTSYVDFTNNVAFDVDGAAFVAEAGDEMGSMVGNMAIFSQGSGGILTDREMQEDFGHEGSGFWLQGAGLRVTDNVSAGHAAYGFIYYTRGLNEPDLGQRVSFPAANLPDPSIARGADRVPVAEVPIQNFADNVAYGNWIGLTMRYHQDLGLHEQESLIEDFTAWNNLTGVNIPYTHQTILRNLTLLAVPGKPDGVGVRTSRLTGDITLENVYIEGFAAGFRAPSVGQNVIRNGYFNNVTNLLVGTATLPGRSVLVTGDIRFGVLAHELLDGRQQQDLVLGVHLWTNQRQLEPVFSPDRILLDYGPFHVQQVYFPEQLPASIPFPYEHFLVPSQYVGLSSQQLLDEFGVAIGGSLVPADGLWVERMNGSISRATFGEQESSSAI
jgi:hypothetical protein